MRAKVTKRGSVAGAVRLLHSTLTKIVAGLRKEMTARAKEAFDVGGHQAHGGRKWRRLSPWTVDYKRRKGFPRPDAPLVRTGAMKRNAQVLVNLSLVPGVGVRYSITSWNQKLYSQPHMTGYPNRWTGTFVPKRPPVAITKDDLKYVESVISRYLNRGRGRK